MNTIFFSSRDIVAHTNPNPTLLIFLESRLDVWLDARECRVYMLEKDILFLFKDGEVPGDYLREASLKDTRECDRFARYFRRH